MEEAPKKNGSFFTRWYVQLGVLFGALFLYIITNQNIFFGLLLGALIIAMVLLEVRQGAKEHGWKNEIIDTVIALAVAVVIWYGASFFLNTPSPASAVVSCSMLPNLQRGDFVVIQGAPADAFDILMDEQEVAGLAGDAHIEYKGEQRVVKGSIFSYCNAIADPICDSFYNKPEEFVEKKGALTYHYSLCTIRREKSESDVPCVTSVSYNGTSYPVQTTGDTIVYGAGKDEYFSLIGDIVHRAYFTVKTPEGRSYYLTKGDNNPILDVQVYDYRFGLGNNAVNPEEYKGKVLFRVPYIGYFKLVISGFLKEDDQCRTQLVY